MIGLGGVPGGGFFEAYDVSRRIGDRWTGGYGFPGGAFIWDLYGMRNVKALLVNNLGLNLTGWQLRGQRVSQDGLTIAGDGISPSGQDEAWVAHLPEPCSLTSGGRSSSDGTAASRR
jgi:hypothetical protein